MIEIYCIVKWATKIGIHFLKKNMELQAPEGNCAFPLFFSPLDYYIFHLFAKFAVQSIWFWR